MPACAAYCGSIPTAVGEAKLVQPLGLALLSGGPLDASTVYCAIISSLIMLLLGRVWSRPKRLTVILVCYTCLTVILVCYTCLTVILVCYTYILRSFVSIASATTPETWLCFVRKTCTAAARFVACHPACVTPR